MKKLYPFATLLLATLILFFSAKAQTFTGGTYTAVRTGFNWNIPSGPNAWDPHGQPPANCINCLIIINSGVTVTLNTSVTLTQGSVLKIGSGGSSAALLQIPSSSGTDWASSFNLILPSDGSSPASQIVLGNNS